jgi:hypothetical protein
LAVLMVLFLHLQVPCIRLTNFFKIHMVGTTRQLSQTQQISVHLAEITLPFPKNVTFTCLLEILFFIIAFTIAFESLVRLPLNPRKPFLFMSYKHGKASHNFLLQSSLANALSPGVVQSLWNKCGITAEIFDLEKWHVFSKHK